MAIPHLGFILADVPVLNILFLFTPTWIIVLLAGMELFWLLRLQQRYVVSPDTVILPRSPWPIIVPTIILLFCNAAPLFGPLDADSATLPLVFGFFAFIFACAGLVKFPVVFIADQAGLTRSIPFFSKTLPWSAIDWMYIRQTTMIYRSPIGLGHASGQQLVVEAGSGLRLRVSLRRRWTRVKPEMLMRAVQARAVNALVGYDKQARVERRRASGTHIQARS